MQLCFLPGVERAGRFHRGRTGSTGTLWDAASSKLGLDSYLFWCTQTEMGMFNKHSNHVCDTLNCTNVQSRSEWVNLPSVLISGPNWNCASHWDCGSYHGVLVSHQPHCNYADGTLPVLAVPRHLSQLLHMERQPWEKGRVRSAPSMETK